MHLPAWERSTVRTGSYGLALAFALILPIILGYAVASGGTTRPPRAGEITTPQAASITTGADTDEQQAITGVPVGDAPSTAEEALTRREDAVAGIPRIRYINARTLKLDKAHGMAFVRYEADWTGELLVDMGGPKSDEIWALRAAAIAAIASEG